MTRSALKLAPFAMALAALLTACAPGAQLFAPPTFALVASESGIQRLDPPGIGSGEATIRLIMDVSNPNPVGLRLAGLDGSLFVDGRRVADAEVRNGIDLPANGRGRLTLDTAVPLVGAAQLIADLAGLVGGNPIEVQLDASATVTIFGAQQRLPTATLVRTTLRAPISVVAPTVTLDREGSGLRSVGPTGATLVLLLRVTNPNPIGFGLTAPALELALAGRTVATAELAATPVPAFATTSAEVVVALDFAALGPALASQVGLAAAGAQTLEVALFGPLLLEAPGVVTLPIEPAALFDGTL